MKSIDLLFPPEQGDTTKQIPADVTGAGLVEQLSKTLVEVVEKQNDLNKDLSTTFKETITEVLSKQTMNPDESEQEEQQETQEVVE